ncbi:response regulator [Methylobacterium sp. J-068]|uniref:response regulator n=1 Tax=Methylobacterium sp. J-068 TaxID=2836649 RepID=UPI001FB905F0|nr:response regulator [Methylobacterium sp. J-068]MCJ2037308.1 response regulator [Methylobacterium sp. J-068]
MARLEGRRVLLVEDESLVAMLGEDMLLELGCEVELAMRLDKALSLARGGDFDMAILDVNLGETCSYPIADVLFERCIPFIFATGYGTAGIEPAYNAIPVMQKPYQIGQMATLLRHLLACETLAQKGTDPGKALTCTCAVGLGTRGPTQIRAD